MCDASVGHHPNAERPAERVRHARFGSVERVTAGSKIGMVLVNLRPGIEPVRTDMVEPRRGKIAMEFLFETKDLNMASMRANVRQGRDNRNAVFKLPGL